MRGLTAHEAGCCGCSAETDGHDQLDPALPGTNATPIYIVTAAPTASARDVWSDSPPK